MQYFVTLSLLHILLYTNKYSDITIVQNKNNDITYEGNYLAGISLLTK